MSIGSQIKKGEKTVTLRFIFFILLYVHDIQKKVGSVMQHLYFGEVSKWYICHIEVTFDVMRNSYGIRSAVFHNLIIWFRN